MRSGDGRGTAFVAHPTARPRALQAIRALEAWGDSRDWEGPDPYDALNARALPQALRRWPLALRALTQAVKRSPADLRPVLGIRPGRSAVTLAHLVATYARNGFLGEAEASGKLARAVGGLADLRLSSFEDACWGYHFDVQTRVFFYPSTAPNTIASSFAGLALLDAYERTGNERALELASSAGRFFLAHVPQTPTPSGGYFGYLVGDRTPIHNASMMVSALLARLSRHVDDPRFEAAAADGVRYTVTRQRPDGSWPYGEDPSLDWVDGFHTGYVLDSLRHCGLAGIDEGAATAWEHGLDYYRRELFLSDGTPKYTPASVHPIDAQCAAQAVQTFSLASHHDPGFAKSARSVFDYALRRLRRGDGAFVFQRRRHWTNRTPHVRWVQAPMLSALAHFLEVRSP